MESKRLTVLHHLQRCLPKIISTCLNLFELCAKYCRFPFWTPCQWIAHSLEQTSEILLVSSLIFACMTAGSMATSSARESSEGEVEACSESNRFISCTSPAGDNVALLPSGDMPAFSLAISAFSWLIFSLQTTNQFRPTAFSSSRANRVLVLDNTYFTFFFSKFKKRVFNVFLK